MSGTTERNVFFGVLAAVILYLLWSKFASASAANSPAESAGVPTVSDPTFTPTYLNYNQAPYDNRPPLQTVTYAPVNTNLQPIKPLSNPKLNAPSCGCNGHKKNANPRSVAIFGSEQSMERYYTSGAGKTLADAWAANMPTSLIQ